MSSSNIASKPAVLPRRRALIFDRLRFQLLGCFVAAVGLPYLIGMWILPGFTTATQTYQALVGSISAIILGMWLYRSLSVFPGIRASSYILPSFGLSYTAVWTIFLLGRLEYNRLLLVFGAFATVGWFYTIAVVAVRRRRMRIGVVAMGDTMNFDHVTDIEWIPLTGSEHDDPGVDAVVADLRVTLPDAWDRRLTEYALRGVPVYHVKQLQESLSGRVELEHLSENSLGTLTPAHAYFRAKQIVDWLVAVLALLVLWPLFLVVAVFVSLDSPGSPIFRQARVGHRGKIFTVYKFRTMAIADAHRLDAKVAAQTQHNDQRITRIGRLLRKTRIDELPQLFNVVRGEMSWIGPRPEALVLSRWYETEIPFYRYRHIVLPGLTGWAQVNQGHVVDVDDIKDKLHYDFFYIKNFSPWIDILIVVRTIQTILTGFGHR